MDWCILRTAGRETMRLAKTLAEDGFDVWTPIETRRVRIPRLNARRVVRVPILAGFVFAKEQHLPDLLELEHERRGWRVLFVNGGPAIAADGQLDPLRKAEHLVEPKRWSSAFKSGSEVRITKGSFTGMSGLVKSCNGKDAELWVSIFGRHHRVKISTFNLQLIVPCEEQAALAA